MPTRSSRSPVAHVGLVATAAQTVRSGSCARTPSTSDSMSGRAATAAAYGGVEIGGQLARRLRWLRTDSSLPVRANTGVGIGDGPRSAGSSRGVRSRHAPHDGGCVGNHDFEYLGSDAHIGGCGSAHGLRARLDERSNRVRWQRGMRSNVAPNIPDTDLQQPFELRRRGCGRKRGDQLRGFVLNARGAFETLSVPESSSSKGAARIPGTVTGAAASPLAERSARPSPATTEV